MYGGAGGGGKSQALLMDAAKYLHVPGYAALLLRRSYTDLAMPGALIDRAKEWWGGRVPWSDRDKTFRFPSGATVSFGYLEHEDDKYRYASAEFQFVAFDEVSQFTESQYTFLSSRLRRLEGFPVPLRKRCASNPVGRGVEWVKRRFIPPEALRLPKVEFFGRVWYSPGGRAFIPARKEDNASLDQAGYDRSLADLDPLTRAQIKEGDWTAHAGGRFRREWLRYYARRGTHYVLGDKFYTADQVGRRFLTVDPAATVKQTAKADPDYTVISAWGIAPGGDLLWLGCRRVRVEIPDIAPHVWQLYTRYGATAAYVEGFGVGKGPAQLCRRHVPAMSVVEVTPKGKDKLLHAAAALNAAEAGRVWLPAPGAEPSFPLEDVEAELLRFTGDPAQDAHDDVVDTLSYAAAVLTGRDDERRHGFAPYVAGGSP